MVAGLVIKGSDLGREYSWHAIRRRGLRYDPQRDGEAFAPRDLIAEDLQQEILMGHCLLARQGEALGQRVEHAR